MKRVCDTDGNPTPLTTQLSHLDHVYYYFFFFSKHAHANRYSNYTDQSATVTTIYRINNNTPHKQMENISSSSSSSSSCCNNNYDDGLTSLSFTTTQTPCILRVIPIKQRFNLLLHLCFTDLRRISFLIETGC